MTVTDRNRTQLLHQIMALSFTQNDLVLFLDTHPDNPKALRAYHQVTPQLAELMQIYRENYGPLTVSDVTCGSEWNWIHSPWPWEN